MNGLLSLTVNKKKPIVQSFLFLCNNYKKDNIISLGCYREWKGLDWKLKIVAWALDRFVHNSLILELNIPSYRAEQAKKSRQQSTETPSLAQEGR